MNQSQADTGTSSNYKYKRCCTRLTVDGGGLVRADGVVLGRFDPQTREIIVLDKDRHRSARKQTNQVRIPVAAFTDLKSSDKM